jgi:hypothetical protein
MKTRHGKGIHCPHNKGFSIEVIKAGDIDCLACKHILRNDPEAKEAFDKLIVDEKNRLKSLMKPESYKKSWQQKKREAAKVRSVERVTIGDFYSHSVPPCPKCKKAMIKRVNTAKNTQFWGCTQYPKCKGTRNI